MLAHLPQLLTLVTVACLDSLLSVDNALVLAALVAHLPPQQRGQALRYGIPGAYVVRGLGLFAVSFAISLWPLRLLAGMYLVYLGVRHLRPSRETGDASRVSAAPGFWMTVLQVEALDFTFSIDNILATAALSRELWLVIGGVFISILAIRLAASALLGLLERFPTLRTAAYLIVVFVGLKLLGSLARVELSELLTFGIVLLVILAALVREHVARRTSRAGTGAAG